MVVKLASYVGNKCYLLRAKGTGEPCSQTSKLEIYVA